MGMSRAVVVATVLACSCRGEGTRPGSGATGSAETPSPSKIVSLEPFPRCAQKATFEIVPKGPESRDLSSAKLIGDHLLVQSRSNSLEIELAAYDLKARTWRTFPPLKLARSDGELNLGAFATSWGAAVLAQRADGEFIQAFDLESAKWSDSLHVPLKTVNRFIWEVGRQLVLMPFRPCGFGQPADTTVFKNGAFASMPSTLTMRQRPLVDTVAGHLIIWGGEVLPDAPANGDIGCGDAPGSVSTNDGAILDPVSGWKSMAAGPPAFSDRHWAIADHYLFVYGVVRGGAHPELWRYDVAQNAWTRLGTLPDGFARAWSYDEPHMAATVGTSLILHRGGRGSDVPMQVIVGIEDGSMRELKAPAVIPGQVVALDSHHELVIPRALVAPARAYIGDTTSGTWCELGWIDQPPFFTPHGAPFFRTITMYEGKVVAWGPDVAAAGFIATIE